MPDLKEEILFTANSVTFWHCHFYAIVMPSEWNQKSASLCQAEFTVRTKMGLGPFIKGRWNNLSISQFLNKG